MRILVVGGAGYIGSHVVRALSRRFYHPVIYDNLSTGHEYLVRGFELVHADLSEVHRLKNALQGMDAVIQLAGSCNVGDSVVQPKEYFNNNVVNTLRLMDTCLECEVSVFIASSSCATYGNSDGTPISETTSAKPVNPYGLSKLVVDQMLECYSRAYGIKYMSLRYFNAAGADENGDLVEDHQPETHLIASALQTIMGNRSVLEIYGDDYPTPDGTCIRDFVHVNDLADAHLLALDYLLKGGTSGIVNLGTGKGYSIMEVVNTVERITGHAVATKFMNRRLGDPPVLIADSSRAKALLGWQTTRTLDDMVRTAWEAVNCRSAKLIAAR